MGVIAGTMTKHRNRKARFRNKFRNSSRNRTRTDILNRRLGLDIDIWTSWKDRKRCGGNSQSREGKHGSGTGSGTDPG